MIDSKQIEPLIKSNQIQLFKILADVASGIEQLDYECFYEILRLRKKLSIKTLKNTGIAEVVENVFSSGNAYKFVQILTEHELLELVFPGVNALLTVDGGHYHNELVYTHVMGALRALDKNPRLPWFVKLAALYHDVGKYTWEISDEGKRRFMNHAQKGAVITERDMTRLGISKDITGYLVTLVGMHMQQLDKGHSMRKLNRVFSEAKLDPKYFFWVRYADNKGSAVYKTDFMFYWNLYKKFKKSIKVIPKPSVKDLCINGHDLMKKFERGPGKWLGAVLAYLFKGVQERGYLNEKEYLLVEAEKFISWYDGGVLS
jgi:putative nucleotidyltransferase with HDIG domain